MAKFNKLGQWTLEKTDTKLINGIQTAGQEVSNSSDKTEGLKGADVVKIAAQQIAMSRLPEMNKAVPQPTNEQLFGHLVKSEEEIKAAEDRWQSGNKNVVEELSKPIDHLNKSKIEGSWGYGKSFNSMLSKSEVDERNMCVDDK